MKFEHFLKLFLLHHLRQTQPRPQTENGNFGLRTLPLGEVTKNLFLKSLFGCYFQGQQHKEIRKQRLNTTLVKFDDNRWPQKSVPIYEFHLTGHVKRLFQQKV